ncbi:hypothetical protein [Larsenimonas suaedae]|uniref:Uncharacterized protein n=1 Tax=Larsenimonas suaedae TaxID=1851019 RepID=A0ABU1GZ15_9GAMM|nr:hypothetical protein [Larsenimonas suaedae]MCM2973776.1 hypothetical protein [Larsenimonas suaedae]MDR5897300.1 hypothetical protein [Larsenimonas suaedae]
MSNSGKNPGESPTEFKKLEDEIPDLRAYQQSFKPEGFMNRVMASIWMVRRAGFSERHSPRAYHLAKNVALIFQTLGGTAMVLSFLGYFIAHTESYTLTSACSGMALGLFVMVPGLILNAKVEADNYRATRFRRGKEEDDAD